MADIAVIPVAEPQLGVPSAESEASFVTIDREGPHSEPTYDPPSSSSSPVTLFDCSVILFGLAFGITLEVLALVRARQRDAFWIEMGFVADGLTMLYLRLRRTFNPDFAPWLFEKDVRDLVQMVVVPAIKKITIRDVLLSTTTVACVVLLILSNILRGPRIALMYIASVLVYISLGVYVYGKKNNLLRGVSSAIWNAVSRIDIRSLASIMQGLLLAVYSKAISLRPPRISIKDALLYIITAASQAITKALVLILRLLVRSALSLEGAVMALVVAIGAVGVTMIIID